MPQWPFFLSFLSRLTREIGLPFTSVTSVEFISAILSLFLLHPSQVLTQGKALKVPCGVDESGICVFRYGQGVGVMEWEFREKEMAQRQRATNRESLTTNKPTRNISLSLAD